jgi:hypothetical protein
VTAEAAAFGPYQVDQAIGQHVHTFFRGHPVERRRYTGGPITSRVPNFAIYAVGNGPRFNGWTYVTSGCSAAVHENGHGTEFVLSALHDEHSLMELLAMLAFYHAGPASHRFDIGHTVPIGRPWLTGSQCDQALFSLPYPYGSELETCEWPGGHARLLWVLPITSAEATFRHRHGLDALEDRFEAGELNYTNPYRASVV